MIKKERYNKYSTYLKNEYGEKVYKIPINLPVSCPNRDGACGEGGCIFCGDVATGFESQANTLSVKQQMENNIDYIGRRYKAKKFIAYFQNFTSTYIPLALFEQYILEATEISDVVELCISTRPDCISTEYLKVIDRVAKDRNIAVSIELGLQSINHKTLKNINRGHSLAEFIDAIIRIQGFGFKTCCHLIMNLPWDDMSDCIETAKIVSALAVKQVKIHSLYILEGTELGRMYTEGEIQIIDLEEYVDRVVEFIKYLAPNIVMQRLVARAPKESTVFCNWDTSWWKIQDMIDEKLEQENIYQGCKCDYLDNNFAKQKL